MNCISIFKNFSGLQLDGGTDWPIGPSKAQVLKSDDLEFKHHSDTYLLCKPVQVP